MRPTRALRLLAALLALSTDFGLCQVEPASKGVQTPVDDAVVVRTKPIQVQNSVGQGTVQEVVLDEEGGEEFTQQMVMIKEVASNDTAASSSNVTATASVDFGILSNTTTAANATAPAAINESGTVAGNDGSSTLQLIAAKEVKNDTGIQYSNATINETKLGSAFSSNKITKESPTTETTIASSITIDASTLVTNASSEATTNASSSTSTSSISNNTSSLTANTPSLPTNASYEAINATSLATNASITATYTAERIVEVVNNGTEAVKPDNQTSTNVSPNNPANSSYYEDISSTIASSASSKNTTTLGTSTNNTATTTIFPASNGTSTEKNSTSITPAAEGTSEATIPTNSSSQAPSTSNNVTIASTAAPQILQQNFTVDPTVNATTASTTTAGHDDDSAGGPGLLPLELQPKLPPRPRAFDKVVASVDEFAQRIRHGKQQEDEQDSTTPGGVDDEMAEAITAAAAAPAEPHPVTSTTPNPLRPVIVGHAGMVQTFSVGEPFVLQCAAAVAAAASPSSAILRYSWTRNGNVLRANDPVHQIYSESASNGNLLFISPKARDVGTYQCAAENAHGKAFSRATLLVMRKGSPPPKSEGREPRLNDAADVFVVLPQSAPQVQVIDMEAMQAKMDEVQAAVAN